eukprot:6355074-Ditylum_brightwellii.AAC.1
MTFYMQSTVKIFPFAMTDGVVRGHWHPDTAAEIMPFSNVGAVLIWNNGEKEICGTCCNT